MKEVEDVDRGNIGYTNGRVRRVRSRKRTGRPGIVRRHVEMSREVMYSARDAIDCCSLRLSY